METKYIVQFDRLSMKDVAQVGGKNASLGEMIGSLAPLGIEVPDGFALTAAAFDTFLSSTLVGISKNFKIPTSSKQGLGELRICAKGIPSG